MDEIADQVTITHEVRGEGGTYVAEVPGESATGYLEWEPGGESVRVATHTVVPRAIGGRGIAGLLVERLIAEVQAADMSMLPRARQRDLERALGSLGDSFVGRMTQLVQANRCRVKLHRCDPGSSKTGKGGAS